MPARPSSSASASELGERPLIALGLAERRAERAPSDALRLFDVALGGDLHGLRTRGKVALRAAEVAFVLENAERARGYLAIAMSEPETREQARMESLRHRPERAQATTLLSAELRESSVLTERGLGCLARVRQRARKKRLRASCRARCSPPVRSEPRRSLRPTPPKRDAAPKTRRVVLAAASAARREHRRTDQRPPPSPVYDKPTPPSLANARPNVSGRYSVAPPAVEEVAAARARAEHSTAARAKRASALAARRHSRGAFGAGQHAGIAHRPKPAINRRRRAPKICVTMAISRRRAPVNQPSSKRSTTVRWRPAWSWSRSSKIAPVAPKIW